MGDGKRVRLDQSEVEKDAHDRRGKRFVGFVGKERGHYFCGRGGDREPCALAPPASGDRISALRQP